MTIATRVLGVSGPQVSAIGLGAMGMSDLYGAADENESLAMLHARLVEALGRVARRLGVMTSQVAVAWVAAQGDGIVPLVGARRRERLAESLGAAEIKLDAGALVEIEAAVPLGAAAGDRYAAPLMATLDSER